MVPARGQAAQAGNASAQYNLGSLHATGYDLPVDLGVAATWYAKAAAAGHTKAQLDLGTIQIHGLTGARDFMRGLALLRQAARQKTTADAAGRRIDEACDQASLPAELAACATP